MSTIIVNVDQIAYHHGAQLVLDRVSWEIQTGQKIGLVGPNGAGKSTLLRLIAGDLAPDSGFLFRHKDITIGYLAQEPQLDPQQTVWTEAMSANTEIQRLETEMRRLEARMAEPRVYEDEDTLNRVLTLHARAQETFEEQGGYGYESNVQQALETVGFHADDFGLPVATLSGGQRKMLGLAKLLVLKPSMLLLDEPDNHLDLAGKTYLEHLIQDFPGAVVIVSHDRYLLDEVTDHIAEIENHHLTLYLGNYAAYSTEKQLRLLRQQQLYEAQQKEISRIEAAIARFELWASLVVDVRHIRQAHARQKMLDRMDKIEKPTFEHERMGLALNGWRGSNKVLDIVDLDKSFPVGEAQVGQNDDENIVLLGLNLRIWHGERVALLGANGTGKSVLFRCILGLEAPSSGIIKIGPSVRIGYYAQQHETLNPDRTLIEEIWETKSMSEHAAVNFLRRFLFPYQRVRDKVSTLSGGERSRLQLAKLMLSDANFLLLDEPTNNLDLPSCEVLEQALDEFEGTLLVISHDRYFLDRVVTRIVDLEDGALTTYDGDYTYYAEQKGLAIPKQNAS